MDPALHLRWSLSQGGHEATSALTQATDARHRRVLEAKRSPHEPLVMRPLRDAAGGQVEFFIPLYSGSHAAGFLAAVFSLPALLDPLVRDVASGFVVSLQEGGDEFYRYPGKTGHGRAVWSTERVVGPYGAQWRVRVSPTRKRLAEMHPRLPFDALIMGLGLSVLLAWAVHLAQTARCRGTRMNAAEQALRDSEQAYRVLTERLPGIIVYRRSLGGGHRVHYLNVMPAPMAGFSAEEVESGCCLEDRVLAEDKPRLRSALTRAIQENRSFEVEYRIRHQDGSTRHLLERGTPILTSKCKAAYIDGIIIDVTERKQLRESLERYESALKALSARILAAQEEERKRIACELHDGIGQCMTHIKFRTELGLRMLAEGRASAARDFLQAGLPMMQQAIEEVRRVSSNLRPPLLDELGIVATLSWLCDQFRDTHPGIDVDLRIGVEEREVPDALKICIVRIVQEAMNNAVKHADADRLCISLKRAGAGVELAISDDGQGFQPDGRRPGGTGGCGLGLVSMKERAELSSGCFSVESVRGNGTTVRVLWPRIGEVSATPLQGDQPFLNGERRERGDVV